MNQRLGLNVHTHASLLDTAAGAGCSWVRADFLWPVIEPEPGRFEWAIYDELVQAAEQRGLRVLAVLKDAPSWMVAPPAAYYYGELCRAVAMRYLGRIAAYELWNEPNLKRFWSGTSSQYVARVLRPGTAAIRNADPAALIGAPGLAHIRRRDWGRWLLDVLAADPSLDFLSHHCYASTPAKLERKLRGRTIFGRWPKLWRFVEPSLREVLDRARWGGRIWLTETGWASNRVGEHQQAEHLRALASLELCETVFIYEAQDDPRIPEKWGLLRADGSPKPALAALRRTV